MSYHWEGTVWQSKDRTWNHGFYARVPGVSNDPDFGYDPEWDDDFDFTKFALVGTGFKSEEDAAQMSGPMGNGGGSPTIKYWGNAKVCQKLDRMVAKADKVETPRDRRFW